MEARLKQVVANNRGEVHAREAPMLRLEGSDAVVQTICSVFGVVLTDGGA